MKITKKWQQRIRKVRIIIIVYMKYEKGWIVIYKYIRFKIIMHYEKLKDKCFLWLVFNIS